MNMNQLIKLRFSTKEKKITLFSLLRVKNIPLLISIFSKEFERKLPTIPNVKNIFMEIMSHSLFGDDGVFPV